jgi:hypothetical protein
MFTFQHYREIKKEKKIKRRKKVLKKCWNYVTHAEREKNQNLMKSFSLICSQLAQTQCLAHIPMVYQTKPDSLQWFGCGDILAQGFILLLRWIFNRPHCAVVMDTKIIPGSRDYKL